MAPPGEGAAEPASGEGGPAGVGSPDGPAHYLLSSTLAHSGAVTHAASGCFRAPGCAEVLLARDASLQLCSADLRRSGRIQPLFVPILSLQTFAWAQLPSWADAAEAEDRGKDLVLLLSATGVVVLLRFSARLDRFVSASGCLSVPGDWPTRLLHASLHATSPFVAAASPTQVLLVPAELRPSPHAAPWATDGCTARVEAESGFTVASVCQLPCTSGSGGHTPLVAVLARPTPSASASLPLLTVHACSFGADGRALRGFVRLSVFQFAHSKAGWPLELSAIPPSGQRHCQGVAVLRERGLSLLPLRQLLGAAGCVTEEQTLAGLPAEGLGSHAWVLQASGWPLLLLSCGYGSDACLYVLPLHESGQPGASQPWYKPTDRLVSSQGFARALPNPAACLLLAARDCLLLALQGGAPYRLRPAAGGASLAAALLHDGEAGGQPPPEPLAVGWDQEGRRVRWGRLAGEQLDWGGAPLRDCFCPGAAGAAPPPGQPVLNPLVHSAEVIALSGDGHSSCLAFVRCLPAPPVKAQGPRQASAVTGLWSVAHCAASGSRLTHRLVLVSFADASRALTAGGSMADCSNAAGICQSEATLHCDALCEGAFAQVTRSHARCCGLGGLQTEADAEQQPEAGAPKRHSPLPARSGGGGAAPWPAPAGGGTECMQEAPSDAPAGARAALDPGSPVPGRVWLPPRGSSIGAAACAAGLLWLHHSGGGGRLACLRCEEPPGGQKRKRGARAPPRLALAGEQPLAGEASCMAAERCPHGGHLVAVSLRGPSLQLLRAQQGPGGSVRLAALASLSSEALHASLAAACLPPLQLLGHDPAECLRFLPAPAAAGGGQGAAAVPGPVQLLTSWRSGAVLHLELSGGQPGSGGGGGGPAARLLGVWRLGPTPVLLRELPAERPTFLALGARCCLLELDAAQGRLRSSCLDLPGVQHAAPMFVDAGEGGRLRLLACAVAAPAPRLQIRRLHERPEWLSGACVAAKALQPDTPLALVHMPATESVLSLSAARLQLLTAGGRTRTLELSLAFGERAVCAAVWRPEPSGLARAAARDSQQEPLRLAGGSASEDGSSEDEEHEPEAAAADAGQAAAAAEAGAGAEDAAEVEAGAGMEAAGGELPAADSPRGGPRGPSSSEEALQLCTWLDEQLQLDRLAQLDPRRLLLTQPSILEEELLVVGTDLAAWQQQDVRLESEHTASGLSGAQLCEPRGRLLLLRPHSNVRGGPFCAQLGLPGAVHGLATTLQGGRDPEQLLLAMTGSRLVAFRGTAGPDPNGLLLQPLLSRRLDLRPSQMQGSPVRGVAVADPEQGAALLWLGCAQRRMRCGVAVAHSERQAATSACGVPGPEPEAVVGPAMLSVDEHGMLLLGRQLPPGQPASEPPPVSGASLGCPLVRACRGLTAPEGAAEAALPEYLAGSALGQLFRVQWAPRPAARLLLPLEAALAQHAATRPVTGDCERCLRRGMREAPVEEASVVADGDLLLEFLHLPRGVQAELAAEVAARVGAPTHALALELLLRDLLERGPGEE